MQALKVAHDVEEYCSKRRRRRFMRSRQMLIVCLNILNPLNPQSNYLMFCVCKILTCLLDIEYILLCMVVVRWAFFRRPGKNLILNGLLGELLSSLFLNKLTKSSKNVR